MPKKIKPNKFAGFWIRFIAFLIDAVILFIFNSILAAIFQLQALDIISQTGSLVIFRHPLFLVIGWLYYALWESSGKQATIGKLALNLKVTNGESEPINFGKATGRFFGKFLSILIMYIGFLMIAFTKKKQGLHDKMAGCLVIKNH